MTSSVPSNMKAISVNTWAQGPKYTSIPVPQPDSETVQIRVLASGLHQVVRSQSSGQHYTAAKAQLPYIPGADGAGLTPDGKLVYFNCLATGGALAEYVNVSPSQTFPIPVPEGTSEEEKRKLAIRFASLMNPAMSGWMGLTTRTSTLPKDFTVVIMGVTSYSGQIAVKLSRMLGAKKVIGIARSTDKLAKLDLDISIPLLDPVESTDLSILQTEKPDIILDYIYGPAAAHLLNSLFSTPRQAHLCKVDYVSIGSLGGPEMNLPSAVLRSKNITIRGSGPGSWSITTELAEQMPKLIERMTEGVGEFEVVQRRLEDAEAAYADSKHRTVFVM